MFLPPYLTPGMDVHALSLSLSLSLSHTHKHTPQSLGSGEIYAVLGMRTVSEANIGDTFGHAHHPITPYLGSNQLHQYRSVKVSLLGVVRSWVDVSDP